MSNQNSQPTEIKFKNVNYNIFSFKYPLVFKHEIMDIVLSIFKENANKEHYYLSLDELEDQFYKKDNTIQVKYSQYLVSNWQKKDSSEEDFSKKIKETHTKALKENIKILLDEYILESVIMVDWDKDRNRLLAKKKYYLDQINKDLDELSRIESKAVIVDYTISRMKSYRYPFISFFTKRTFLQGVNEYISEVYSLLNDLIEEYQIVLIPMVVMDLDRRIRANVIYPGLAYRNEVMAYLDQNLIPTLQNRFVSIRPSVENLYHKYNLSISLEDINQNHKKPIYQFCALILEANSKKEKIDPSDYTLAQLILYSWLFLEDDPVTLIMDYLKVDLDYDFLSPFLTHYSTDLKYITDHLVKMKGFVEHIPQVIEKSELTDFFKSKKVPDNIIIRFFAKLPVEILLVHYNKEEYIVAKSQIIKAIKYLYFANFHRNTESGKVQFNVLAHAFHRMEQTSKNLSILFFDLNTNYIEYMQVKKLLQDSDIYRALEKKNDKKEDDLQDVPSPELPEQAKLLPNKLFYRSDDFEDLSPEDLKRVISALNLMTIYCVDNNKNHRTFYIKRSELTFDDARFLRSKPTYELLCKRFNISC